MKRRMPKPNNTLQSPAMSPLAVFADESERAQVVPPAVSFRRMRLMPKDRQRHLMMMTAAVGALFGLTTNAFRPTSPFTRYSSYNIMHPEMFYSGTFAPSSSSSLFVASMPKKNADANPQHFGREPFGREGGADSVGLQSGLGADVSRLGASEMTSILDDGSGHVNAELARSIWQWENEHLKNMTEASDSKDSSKTNPFPAADIKFSTRKGLQMIKEIAGDLLALQTEESSVTFSDLVQEGVLSLISALAKYDPSHPKATGGPSGFETYARHKILIGMEKALADAAYRPLRLPAYVYDTLKRAQVESTKLQTELDRDPTLTEVANRIRVEPKKLQFYTLAARNSLPVESTVEIYDPDSGSTAYADEETFQRSLTESPSHDGAYLHAGEVEEVLGEEEEEWVEPTAKRVAPLRDFIADESAEGNPSQLAFQEMMRMDIEDLLRKTLDEREVDIIRLKFGLDGGTYDVEDDEDAGGGGKTKNGLTFAEIGKRLRLSPQRVAQLEQSALEKLRQNYSSVFVEQWLEEEHGDEVSM